MTTPELYAVYPSQSYVWDPSLEAYVLDTSGAEDLVNSAYDKMKDAVDGAENTLEEMLKDEYDMEEIESLDPKNIGDIEYSNTGTVDDVPTLTPYTPYIKPSLYNFVSGGIDCTLETLPDLWLPTSLPEEVGEAPSFPVIAVPNTTDPQDPGDPPVLETLTVPPPPTLDLPPDPVTDDVIIPDAPALTIPSFAGTEPDFDVTPPDASFSYDEADYESTLADAIKAKLENDVENGGTGLDADVEDDIWTRARARKDTQNERVFDEAENYFSARGWSLPPGALAGRLAEARAEMERADAQINYEISIEQARLAQTNTHFVIDKGITYEQYLMAHFDAVWNRQLEYARTVVTSAIAVHKARVDAYNAQLMAYQVNAEVYKARVEAMFAEVEVFKAQVEGAKVSAEVQKNIVEIYSAKVRGLIASAELYTAQVNGVRAAAEVEKTKVESYGIKVNAYVARINGNVAKYELYKARVQGQEMRARIYESQVNAWSTRIESYGKMVNAARLQLDMYIERNKEKLQKYATDIEYYKAQMQRESEENKTMIERYGLDVENYKAQQYANANESQIRIKQAELLMANARNQLDQAIAQAAQDMEIEKSRVDLQMEKAKLMIGLQTQILTSYIASFNATATISDSWSENWSAGYTQSQSIINSFEEQG